MTGQPSRLRTPSNRILPLMAILLVLAAGIFPGGAGAAELGTGDLAEAEKAALLAMHLNPTDPEGGILVARIYEMGHNLSLAINTYEQVLATPGVTPTAPLLANLGRLYRQEQRYNEARDKLTHAVMIDSTYTPALKDLGDLYRLANQHDKAARVYLRYSNWCRMTARRCWTWPTRATASVVSPRAPRPPHRAGSASPMIRSPSSSSPARACAATTTPPRPRPPR